MLPSEFFELPVLAPEQAVLNSVVLRLAEWASHIIRHVPCVMQPAQGPEPIEEKGLDDGGVVVGKVVGL